MDYSSHMSHLEDGCYDKSTLTEASCRSLRLPNSNAASKASWRQYASLEMADSTSGVVNTPNSPLSPAIIWSLVR